MTAAAKSRLVEIVKARSFSKGGETKLVSGRSTNFYFDMKPSMLHAESAHLIATLMLEALQGSHVDYIGGLEMGAVPLATAVCVLSHGQGRPIGAFFVRKQAKEHGARKLVEGLAPGETRDHGRRPPGGSRGNLQGRRRPLPSLADHDRFQVMSGTERYLVLIYDIISGILANA